MQISLLWQFFQTHAFRRPHALLGDPEWLTEGIGRIKTALVRVADPHTSHRRLIIKRAAVDLNAMTSRDQRWRPAGVNARSRQFQQGPATDGAIR